MDYVKSVVTSAVSYMSGKEEAMDVAQSDKLSPDQVQNNAGGFVWKVQDMDRLRRFLCLGSEGGTYYIKEQALGLENAQCITRLIEQGKGIDVVNEVVTFSVDGRTAKQNSIMFVLAMCARQEKDIATKKLAYEKLSDVCRIPTHLFMFIEYAEKLSAGTGWGKAHRKAISKWYLQYETQPMKLAQHVTKYKNRNGWTHRDVLRLAHPKPSADGNCVAAILRYIIKGLEGAQESYLKEESDETVKKIFSYLQAVEDLKVAKEEEAIVDLITSHGLVREHVPTNYLNSVLVWQTLLKNMPMTAMIRNLGKMSSIGLLVEGSTEVKLVMDKLRNGEILKAARIHPFNVLVAMKTYQQGRGDKGKLAWTPVNDICRSLEDAFYKSFKYVEPTNKRYLLALDVSGSMGCSILGTNVVSCSAGSAAMAMVTVGTEKQCEVVGFSTSLKKIDITEGMKLDRVMDKVNKMSMGGTDCAQPMRWATTNKKKIDVFIVYTDCETWAGRVHPAEALRKYRKASGIWDAKLIVCAMTSNGFTLADPEDPGMLDMAGFDSNAPEVMKNFVMGKI